ncbi:hypothetical protein Tco_1273070 [Tanacetum coccineum]
MVQSIYDKQRHENEAIELYDEEGSEFIVNKQRVKPYQKNLLDTNREDDVTLDDDKEVTYFSFGRHLEDLHVTSAHLEKKQTRLLTNTKTLEDLCSQSLEMVSQVILDAITTHKLTASQHFMTSSAHTNSHADLEDSTYDGVTTKMRCRRINVYLSDVASLRWMSMLGLENHIWTVSIVDMSQGKQLCRKDTISLKVFILPFPANIVDANS